LVAIVLLLALMRVPVTADLMMTSMRATSERRRNKDRRKKRRRITFERRHRYRRLEDVATHYVERISEQEDLRV
jgi:hypothetical protein